MFEPNADKPSLSCGVDAKQTLANSDESQISICSVKIQISEPYTISVSKSTKLKEENENFLKGKEIQIEILKPTFDIPAIRWN